MTLEELKDIFSKAEATISGRGFPPVYQYYHFTKRNRSAGVVATDGIESLVEILENFKFKEYAPGGIPVFVEIENTTKSIENN
jgi:hypothetical protein